MDSDNYEHVNEIMCTPSGDKFNCKLYKVLEDRERTLVASIEDLTFIQSNTEKTVLSNHPESPINLYVRDRLKCELTEFPEAGVKMLDCRHY